MMRLLFLTLFALSLGALALLPARAADPVPTETSGTIVAIDIPNSLMTVNTRLGPKAFIIDNTALVFVNGRPGTPQSIQVGDRVDLAYYFDTGLVTTVEIIRETSRRGRVVSATETTVTYQVNGTGRITFTTDDLTQASVGGVGVADFRALAGITGNAVFQPGGTSPLLLRFAGTGTLFAGRVVSVDAVNSTLVVAARRSLPFRLVQFGTVRLNGADSDLASLAPGDRVRLGFVRRAGALRAITIHAFR